VQNTKKKNHIMTVLALNGLVGKASVLPSAPIRIYVLVANDKGEVCWTLWRKMVVILSRDSTE